MPQDLWNMALFLHFQGRPFEACRLMQKAYDRLEDTEASPDVIAQFFFDWARMEAAPDLIRVPLFEFALSLLGSVPEYAPEMAPAVEEEKLRVLERQNSFMDGIFRFLTTGDDLKVLNFRNRAQKALVSRNLPEAIYWIIKMEVFLETVPASVLPYMQWLLKTALDCREASDSRIVEASNNALGFLLENQSRLSAAGMLWPSTWADYLRETGMCVGFLADNAT